MFSDSDTNTNSKKRSKSSYKVHNHLSILFYLRENQTMEEAIKEQPSADVVSGNSAAARPKLQRYALRSSSKSKEHKPEASDFFIPSESKRGRSSPSVSRSVAVLDFSGKDKSSTAKPPRRLSIPVKASTATPSPRPIGNTTPISETRTTRSGNDQGPQRRIQTPVSNIFRSSTRKKFSLLSSASYWLNQIKLSESEARHSISLRFFKLALEAECEPFPKMQEELKSYVHRHQLAAELGERVKKVLQSYNIAENIAEQSQVSESISQLPEEGTRSSSDDNDEVHCSSPSTKCFNTDSTQFTPPPVPITESTKKDNTCQKKNFGSSSLRQNLRTKSANSRPSPASDSVLNRRSVKKPEKVSKPESNKKREVKKHGKKSDVKEVSVSPTHAGDNVPENKENMDVRATDEGFAEVV